MARRREPEDDLGDEARRRFWDSPAGWLLSAVAIAALVGLWLLSPIAVLAVGALLAAVELVDQVRQRRRPWLVEARASESQRELAWRVAGRRRSSQVADEVAGALERGRSGLDPPGAERL